MTSCTHTHTKNKQCKHDRRIVKRVRMRKKSKSMADMEYDENNLNRMRPNSGKSSVQNEKCGLFALSRFRNCFNIY